MSKAATHRCPSCRKGPLEAFFRMAGVPVMSCHLAGSRAEAMAFPRGDVELGFCSECGFIGNRVFEPERVRYTSSYEESQVYSAHFRGFLEKQAYDLVERHRLAGRTVLEIGSGQGDFLVELCRRGVGAAVGVDPSVRPDRVPRELRDRIRWLPESYGEQHAGLCADFLCCRHTLEHIHQPAEFVELVRRSLGERGDCCVFFEVPEVRRVLREAAFWDVYYEHCSYFCAGSLRSLFQRSGFAVTRIWTDYDDQYLLLEASPSGPIPSPEGDKERGDLAELSLEVQRFAGQVAARLEAWRAKLERWRRAGRRVAVWGSGSKAVAFLHAMCGAGEVAAVVDVNPHRHGRYLAGSGQEILPPEHLREHPADVVVILNPVYRSEIEADLRRWNVAADLHEL